MIAQRMKHSLKALSVLADVTAKKCLEHSLPEIRNAGAIVLVSGRLGGFFLVKKPTEVSFSDPLRSIDGPIAPLLCLSHPCLRSEDCADMATCRNRRVFAEVFWSDRVRNESARLPDIQPSAAVVGRTQGTGEIY